MSGRAVEARGPQGQRALVFQARCRRAARNPMGSRDWLAAWRSSSWLLGSSRWDAAPSRSGAGARTASEKRPSARNGSLPPPIKGAAAADRGADNPLRLPLSRQHNREGRCRILAEGRHSCRDPRRQETGDDPGSRGSALSQNSVNLGRRTFAKTRQPRTSRDADGLSGLLRARGCSDMARRGFGCLVPAGGEVHVVLR